MIQLFNQLKLLLGTPTGSDMVVYFSYANEMKKGLLPYVGFHPEYPPLALGIFYLPYLVTKDPVFYIFLFQLFIGIVVASGALILYLWKRDINRVWLYLFALFLMQSSSYKFLFGRFDIYPAVITLLAVYFFFHKQWERIGWITLFLGVMTKIYPVILFPLFFLKAKSKWKSLWFLLPMLISNGLILYFTNGGYLEFFSRQGFRPSELESFPSSILMGIHFFIQTPIKPFYFSQVCSWGLEIIKSQLFYFRICSYGLTFAPLALCLRKIKTYPSVRIAVMLLTAFMISNIVFSPQYFIWLIPFLPFLTTSEVLLFLVAAGLSSWTFIFWQDWQMNNDWLYLFIFMKNIFFLLFYYKLFITKEDFVLIAKKVIHGFLRLIHPKQVEHRQTAY